MTLKKIAGKTFPEWEKNIVSLEDAIIKDANDLKQVGVFFVKDKKTKKIMYIGRGTEYKNGGLKKRMADFMRASDSARDHYAGKMIHDNLEDLDFEVILMGTTPEAAQTAKDLRDELIKRYNPVWNK